MMKITGNTIKEHRAELEMSQQALADYCGVDCDMIDNVEQNRIVPSLELAATIAVCLDAPLAMLFSFDKTA